MRFSEFLWWFIGGLPLLVLAVYVVMRVGAAGFFKSKQQFDNRSKSNGTK